MKEETKIKKFMKIIKEYIDVIAFLLMTIVLVGLICKKTLSLHSSIFVFLVMTIGCRTMEWAPENRENEIKQKIFKVLFGIYSAAVIIIGLGELLM